MPGEATPENDCARFGPPLGIDATCSPSQTSSQLRCPPFSPLPTAIWYTTAGARIGGGGDGNGSGNTGDGVATGGDGTPVRLPALAAAARLPPPPPPASKTRAASLARAACARSKRVRRQEAAGVVRNRVGMEASDALVHTRGMDATKPLLGTTTRVGTHTFLRPEFASRNVLFTALKCDCTQGVSQSHTRIGNTHGDSHETHMNE